MAESQSMTTPEVVAKTLIAEHADFMREAVAMVAARADGGRDPAQIGAGKARSSRLWLNAPKWLPPKALGDQGRGDRAGGARASARGGELLPELPGAAQTKREGTCSGWSMEAYVNGASTRKVDHRSPQSSGIHMSKDQVSRICGELDEQVEAFRTRPLEG